MVITHDNDWSSVITQANRVFFFVFNLSWCSILQYDIMPDPSAVVEDILACHDICEENG